MCIDRAGTLNVAEMLYTPMGEIGRYVRSITFLVNRDDAIMRGIVAHGDHRRSVDFKTGQGLITAGPHVIDVDLSRVPLSHC